MSKQEKDLSLLSGGLATGVRVHEAITADVAQVVQFLMDWHEYTVEREVTVKYSLTRDGALKVQWETVAALADPKKEGQR